MDAYTAIYDWLSWLRDKRERAEQTVDKYATIMGLWMGWCETNSVDPLSPTLEQLEAFVTRKRGNGRKGKPATQELDVYVLRGWYKWCYERRHMSSNPALDLIAPTVKNVDPRPIEDEHWVKMWARDMTPAFRTFLGLGYYAGLRRGELFELKAEHITPTSIRHFVRKGGGESTVPWYRMAEIVHSKLIELLPETAMLSSAVAYSRRQGGFVRPWLGIEQMNDGMDKLCQRVGVPHYSPHQLRHSCATNLLRAGVPLHLTSRLLDHQSVDTTMRYVRAGAGELDQWWKGEQSFEL